jgi:hypothetical protein
VNAVSTAGGHANLATGTGSVLGSRFAHHRRAAMRVQKGKQQEELNLAPVTLLVPAALEQSAYQLTSSQFVPALATSVNEFRQGGRTALDPIVEAILDASSSTAWYLAADNARSTPSSTASSTATRGCTSRTRSASTSTACA